MAIKQSLISKSKYNLKCPYEMKAEGVCVHNTYNDAPAINEINYMKNNNSSTSFHIAIDDKEAIQAIPFNRNAFAAGDGGDGRGNRKYIHIEICYSKSGGEKFLKAEKRAAKEIATLLKERKWGIDRVKKHQDFSRKYCPHRTLDMGWSRFLNMIKKEMGNSSSSSSAATVEEGKNFIGSKCKELQEKLIKLGFNCGGYGADGKYGKATHESLIAFQKKHGLKADGLAGKETFNKLNELIKEQSKPNKPPSNDSKVMYRVVVGTYSDRDNAVEQQKKLKEKGFDSFLVAINK